MMGWKGDSGTTTLSLKWVKSSYSHANGNCIEVAGLSTGLIRVRDSKNPQGPQLQFTSAEWKALLGGIRNGEV